MDKNLSRLMNKIYITSNLKAIVYPIQENSEFFNNTADIEKLLSMGLISVKPYRPTASWDVIIHNDIGVEYITERSELYVSEKLNKRKRNRNKAKRDMSVDFYKRDRNPWMGQRLTRNGGKEMCAICHSINKPCEHGEQHIVALPVDARPPRSTASTNKWRAFKKLFNIGDS